MRKASREVERPESPGRRSRQARGSRSALVTAAVDVFDEHEFGDATISQIASGAGLSHGSFYTYFSSKEDVLRSAVNEIHRRELLERAPELPPGASLRQRIDATNRRFCRTYAQHARLLASFEQVAARDQDTADLRRETRYAYIHRTITSIERWQSAGTIDPNLDAESLAQCLGAMVERVVHMQVVFDDGTGMDRMLDAVSHIWCSALGLDADED